jgi:hypothetical protein
VESKAATAKKRAGHPHFTPKVAEKAAGLPPSVSEGPIPNISGGLSLFAPPLAGDCLPPLLISPSTSTRSPCGPYVVSPQGVRSSANVTEVPDKFVVHHKAAPAQGPSSSSALMSAPAATAKKRRDGPPIAIGKTKGSEASALAVAESVHARSEALTNFNNLVYAKSTEDCKNSKLRLLIKICAAAQIDLFPLTPQHNPGDCCCPSAGRVLQWLHVPGRSKAATHQEGGGRRQNNSTSHYRTRREVWSVDAAPQRDQPKSNPSCGINCRTW